MNTKQKLTLGIAAIFMVTLTIVGVTYAYFVTRVIGETPTSVNVQTASLASVEYGDGNQVITISDVLPGTTTYKTFTVTNNGKVADGAADASYDIFLTSTAGDVEFVNATDETDCYKSDSKPSNDATPTAACFAGSTYNNIKVTLYSYTDAAITTSPITDETFNALNKTAVYDESGLVQTTADSVQVLGQNLTIAAETTVNYILKVEYVNNNQNQNIENLASVSIKVDIR